MDNTPPLAPRACDIASLPEDFGTGRLQNLIVTFDNLGLNVMHVDKHPSFPVKSETFFIVMLMTGEIRLLINLREVTLHGGQLLVMMPGSIFQGVSIDQESQFFGMMLETEYMDIMRKSIGIRLNLTHRYYNFFVRDTSPEVLESNLQMYKIICRELNMEDYTYKKDVIQRYCEAWALKIISFKDETDLLQHNRPVGRKEQIFHDFLTLLEKYYKQERSISFYADRMCLTPKYLSTIIKEVSGKHGMQWIDEYVTLEAKALLRDNSLSVKQVSDQLNFPSQSMFGRFIKKMTGYSPKQYKQL